MERVLTVDRIFQLNSEKSNKFCYSDDGERLFVPAESSNSTGLGISHNIIEIQSGLHETYAGTLISSSFVKYDALLNIHTYVVAIDSERGILSVCNTSRSGDAEVPVAYNPFKIKKYHKIDSWCGYSNGDIHIFFFTSGLKLFAMNLTDGRVLSVKYDFSAFDIPEKKVITASSLISKILCHPAQSILFITVTLSTDVDVILIGNFNPIVSKFAIVDNQPLMEEDEKDTESISETNSVTSASVNNASHGIGRFSSTTKQYDIFPRAVIKGPSANITGRISAVSFHQSGRFLAISWLKDRLALYDCSVNKLDSSRIKSLDPIIAASRNPANITTTGLAFHPHEPFLLHSFQSNDVKDQFIRVLYFIEKEMPCLAVESVNSLLAIDGSCIQSIICAHRSGKILMTLSNGVDSSRSVVVSRFDSQFLATFSHDNPISSKLPIIPDAYIQGDKVLLFEDKEQENSIYSRDNSKRKTSNPFILVVKRELELHKIGQEPALSYQFFQSALGLGVTTDDTNRNDKNPATFTSEKSQGYKYLGRLSSVVEDISEDPYQNWMRLPSEDINTLHGNIFLPQDLKLNYLSLHGSGYTDDFSSMNPSNKLSFEMIIRGNIICQVNKFDVSSYHKSAVSPFPAVCLIRYEKIDNVSLIPNQSLGDQYTVKSIHTKFRDCDFWTGPTSFVECASKENPPGLLALSLSGTSVNWISLNNQASGLDDYPGKVKSKWTFEYEMRRLFVSPRGSPNYVLFVSNRRLSSSERIYMSAHKAPILETNPLMFSLEDDETVIDIVWQSISLHGFGSDTALSDGKDLPKQRREALGNPFIGVLTSSRVLVLNSSLEMMNSLTYRSNESKKNIHNTAIVMSIIWIGSALTFVYDNGRIDYLLPILSLRDLTLRPPSNVTITRLRHSNLRLEDFNRGTLCSIVTYPTCNLRLIACLPDRLLFVISCSDKDGIINSISLRTRPTLPAEPLILGLLADSVRKVDSKQLSATTNVSSALELNFTETTVFPPPFEKIIVRNNIESNFKLPQESQNDGKLTQNRVLSDDQVLHTLSKLAVDYYGKERRSLEAADGTSIQAPSAHISAKLLIALSECGYDSVGSFINGIPSEADAVSIGFQSTGKFPSHGWIQSPLRFDLAMRSGRGTSAALSLHYGNTRTNMYDRIYDPHSLSGGTLPHKKSNVMMQNLAAAKLLHNSKFFEPADKLKNLYNLSSPISDKAEFIDSRSLYSSPNISIKETQLVPLSDATHFSQRSGQDDTLGKMIASRNASESRGRFGPATTQPLLAMNVLDDWLGARCKPEGLSAQSAMASRLFPSSGGSSSVSGDSRQAAVLPTGMSTRPDTWIPDVGQGKDHEKIVGYWRFSDVIYPDEQGFFNTTMSTRINFQDLSKYPTINILELIIVEDSAKVSLEESASNVDPGEDHEKVKALYDIVFKNTIKSSQRIDRIMTELRILVGRGGPLDVGLFHSDHDRGKITIEMILFSGLQQTERNIFPITLFERCVATNLSSGQLAQSIGSLQNVIYRLSVLEDGSLLWELSVGNGNTKPFSVKSEPSCLFNTSDDISMKWSHLSCTLTSQDLGNNMYNISMSIFLNCNLVISGGTQLSMHYKENDINTTFMSFCRNFPNDWRMTELRVWADSKSVSELEENRDNHLGLASKRKRQQMRLKGTKELFRPLRDGFGGIIEMKSPSKVSLPSLKEGTTPSDPSSGDLKENTTTFAATTSTNISKDRSAGLLVAPKLSKPLGNPSGVRKSGIIGTLPTVNESSENLDEAIQSMERIADSGSSHAGSVNANNNTTMKPFGLLSAPAPPSGARSRRSVPKLDENPAT